MERPRYKPSSSEAARSRELFETHHAEQTPEQIQRNEGRAKNFESRWTQPTQIQIGDEKFRAYDISPESTEGDLPTMIVPGWSGTPEVLKENMRTVVKEGLRAFAVEAPHGSTHTIESEFPDAELRRISSFIKGMEATNIARVDAIGHSEGGLDLLIAAHMYPEKFRTVVLVNPAGMIGRDNIASLAARFGYDMIRSFSFAKKQGTMAEKKRQAGLAIPVTFAQPARSFREVLAMARTQVHNLLRSVSEKGVDVVIIHGPEDVVFPMKRMARVIQESKTSPDEDITKLIKGMYSVAGDHNSFIRKAPVYTRLATAAIKIRAVARQSSATL